MVVTTAAGGTNDIGIVDVVRKVGVQKGVVVTGMVTGVEVVGPTTGVCVVTGTGAGAMYVIGDVDVGVEVVEVALDCGG